MGLPSLVNHQFWHYCRIAHCAEAPNVYTNKTRSVLLAAFQQNKQNRLAGRRKKKRFPIAQAGFRKYICKQHHRRCRQQNRYRYLK